MRSSVAWGSRAFALVALAAFLGAVFYGIGSPLLEGDDAATPASPAAPPAASPNPTPPAQAAVKTLPLELDAVGGFDPEGDGSENDVQAVNAVDGDRRSGWKTENYRQFFKSGIGLLLDAGRPVRLTRVTIRSSTPGFLVEIRVGDAETGPFRSASAIVPVNRLVTNVRARGNRGRYVVLWLSGFKEGSVAIEEVSAIRRA